MPLTDTQLQKAKPKLKNDSADSMMFLEMLDEFVENLVQICVMRSQLEASNKTKAGTIALGKNLSICQEILA